MAGNQFKAIHRYARISARKVRLLANLVRGKTVVEALSILEYQPQRRTNRQDLGERIRKEPKRH